MQNNPLIEELNRCAKCGTCKSVCPVFKETQDESLVTRAKLALYEACLKGDLSSSAKLREVLDTCLLCMKCKDKCPSLVKTTALIRQARQWINQQKGLPLPFKLGFRFIIPNRFLFNFAIKMISIVQRLFFKNKPFSRHIPLALIDPFNKLPPLAKKPVLKRYTDRKKITEPQVAIFTGCMINYVFDNIYEKTVRLLDKHILLSGPVHLQKAELMR